MKLKDLKNPFPVVCAAGDLYEICVYTPMQYLISVRVGNNTYYCADNGVRVSAVPVQKFKIPRKELDAVREYTLVCRAVIRRKPYFTECGKETETRFAFYPAEEKEELRVVHLSDVHGRGEAAVKAGLLFGGADLLILNGDISSSSDTVEEVALPLEIAYALTGGERPCVITRGNHDLRGALAENLGVFYPVYQGKTYYTVPLPGYTFLVLDCGEDKTDTCDEYGHTVAFHAFREEETAFLKAVAAVPDLYFGDSRVIVLSHIPFMYRDKDPQFRIEEDLYKEWCLLLRERIRPVFGLFGHLHKNAVIGAGDPFDDKGFGSPIVLGGRPFEDGGKQVEGTCLLLRRDGAAVLFGDSRGSLTEAARFAFD